MSDGLSRTPASGLKRNRGVRLDGIERRPIDWLWKPWLQRGALNVLTGDPGVGKSTIMCAIVASLSTGAALPDAEPKEPINCWIMNGEDSANDTISWRLFNQGADPERVWVTDKRETLNSDVIRDIKREVKLNSIGFLGIDPLQAWMGKELDMHRANETREWGSFLRELAQETNCAVLLARHRRKSQPGENRLYSGMGSIDVTGFARSEISAYRAKDGRLIIQRIKGNVGLTDDPHSGLEYEIVSHPENEHGILEWRGRVLGPETGQPISRTPAKLEEAKLFLFDLLRDGPRNVLDILQEGAKHGLSQRTLERAKKELGVTSTQVKKGVWVWELPSKPCSEAGH